MMEKIGARRGSRCGLRDETFEGRVGGTDCCLAKEAEL